MAMSVVYTTINGMIVQENRGGVKSFYAPDTMGSTVALLNSSGVVTDTYTYWPYGEIRSHVGSSTTPLTFLGMIGYYADVLGSFIYVRARYLRQALTRWQTVDSLWPSESAYSYAMSNPSTVTDRSGLGGGWQFPFDPLVPPRPSPGPPVCAPPSLRSRWNQYIYAYCHSCKLYDTDCQRNCDSLARQYFQACHKHFGDLPYPFGCSGFPFQPTPGGEIAPWPRCIPRDNNPYKPREPDPTGWGLFAQCIRNAISGFGGG